MNIEQGLRIENENLKRLLEETERERDDALAQNDRLREAREELDRQLAPLVASYQARALMSFSRLQKVNEVAGVSPYTADEYASAIIKREQNSKEPCIYPDCRCPIELPHKDSPCAIGRGKYNHDDKTDQ